MLSPLAGLAKNLDILCKFNKANEIRSKMDHLELEAARLISLGRRPEAEALFNPKYSHLRQELEIALGLIIFKGFKN